MYEIDTRAKVVLKSLTYLFLRPAMGSTCTRCWLQTFWRASGRSGEPSDPHLTRTDNPSVPVPVLGQLRTAFRIERRRRPRKTPYDYSNDAFRRRPGLRTGLLISNEFLPILVLSVSTEQHLNATGTLFEANLGKQIEDIYRC